MMLAAVLLIGVLGLAFWLTSKKAVAVPEAPVAEVAPAVPEAEAPVTPEDVLPKPTPEIEEAIQGAVGAPQGSLSGTITDAQTGLPISQAQVAIRPAGTVIPETTMTDDSGRYRFTAIPEGTYQIEVAKGGYTTITTTITISGSTTFNAKLKKPAPVIPPNAVIQGVVGHYIYNAAEDENEIQYWHVSWKNTGQSPVTARCTLAHCPLRAVGRYYASGEAAVATVPPGGVRTPRIYLYVAGREGTVTIKQSYVERIEVSIVDINTGRILDSVEWEAGIVSPRWANRLMKPIYVKI